MNRTNCWKTKILSCFEHRETKEDYIQYKKKEGCIETKLNEHMDK